MLIRQEVQIQQIPQTLQQTQTPQNNPMTELLDFIKSSNITPQQAQEKVQSLISSGQMSQQQFETLKQQAMNIAKFFN